MNRVRRLPAATLPRAPRRGRGWTALSIVFHLALLLLLLVPPALHTGDVQEIEQGAGGAGPAGGGGGGLPAGGAHHTERVRFVALAPMPKPAPVVTPPPTPVVPPPKPVVPPPVTQPAKVDPVPTPPVPAPRASEPATSSASTGAAAGTGTSAAAGAGPGTGGGVGSGVDAGRGSGVGPGTGGGTQANFPPSPIDVFIPPLPMPNKVRGFHLVAQFDVDSAGKVLGFVFTPTPDGGYNRKLDAVFKGFKFRPGTRPDGTPIRMKAQITFDFEP
jgi:protein TonB